MSFKNLSIRKKLTVLMMSISFLILLLLSGLYIVEEYYSARSSLTQELSRSGEALGNSCKRLLMLRKIEMAKEILSSLRVQSNIQAAYLFDENGSPVAEYLAAGDNQFSLRFIARDFSDPENSFWVDLQQPRFLSSLQHFSMFMPIMHEDRQVGTIYLLSDLNVLYNRLNDGVFFVLLLGGVLLFFSWWLAGIMQRPVSAPLLNLVETMGSISRQKNYRLRVRKQGQDEIGLLVDGFNRMLEQIESHQQELVDHQLSLEKTVAQRTEELRKMVAVLELAKLQAEAASEAKSQFLANITHELRTPLIGVLGMNELMFRTSMDEQQQTLATTVQNSGENLLTLINNVLDFSKIEAGKMQLEEREFALYQTIDEVLNLLAPQAEEKGLSLVCKLPKAATCKVLGDEVRIRQVLMNLVGNAIKFTEQGQVSVCVGCRLTDADSAEFEIDIVDTGIGLDAETQQQIFSAFHQADASHTRKYGGSGLGLAIVQQLIELFDGSLTLESVVGQGSTFSIDFCLPLAGQTDFTLPETFKAKTVLVCSEDSVCLDLLTERLTDLGLKVESAGSAAEGWYQLNAAVRRQQPFELIILPFSSVMPDGQRLYQAIRKEPAFRQLRRIYLLKRTQQVDLQAQEHQLYLPIGWDNLYTTLRQSWHELHLVEQVSGDAVAAGDKMEAAHADFKLLLLGGNVASRELVKMALDHLPLEFAVVKDLSQLPAMTAESGCAAILADLAGLSVAELRAWYTQAQPRLPLFVLCTDASEADDLNVPLAGVLTKPFSGCEFANSLESMLGSVSDYLQQPGGGTG